MAGTTGGAGDAAIGTDAAVDSPPGADASADSAAAPDGAADSGTVIGEAGTPVTDAGTYGCGAQQCKLGQQLCYVPANVGPEAGACFDLNGCATCSCIQSQFQCISKCTQAGQEFFVVCQ